MLLTINITQKKKMEKFIVKFYLYSFPNSPLEIEIDKSTTNKECVEILTKYILKNYKAKPFHHRHGFELKLYLFKSVEDFLNNPKIMPMKPYNTTFYDTDGGKYHVIADIQSKVLRYRVFYKKKIFFGEINRKTNNFGDLKKAALDILISEGIKLDLNKIKILINRKHKNKDYLDTISGDPENLHVNIIEKGEFYKKGIYYEADDDENLPFKEKLKQQNFDDIEFDFTTSKKFGLNFISDYKYPTIDNKIQINSSKIGVETKKRLLKQKLHQKLKEEYENKIKEEKEEEKLPEKFEKGNYAVYFEDTGKEMIGKLYDLYTEKLKIFKYNYSKFSTSLNFTEQELNKLFGQEMKIDDNSDGEKIKAEFKKFLAAAIKNFKEEKFENKIIRFHSTIQHCKDIIFSITETYKKKILSDTKSDKDAFEKSETLLQKLNDMIGDQLIPEFKFWIGRIEEVDLDEITRNRLANIYIILQYFENEKITLTRKILIKKKKKPEPKKEEIYENKPKGVYDWDLVQKLKLAQKDTISENKPKEEELKIIEKSKVDENLLEKAIISNKKVVEKLDLNSLNFQLDKAKKHYVNVTKELEIVNKELDEINKTEEDYNKNKLDLTKENLARIKKELEETNKNLEQLSNSFDEPKQKICCDVLGVICSYLNSKEDIFKVHHLQKVWKKNIQNFETNIRYIISSEKQMELAAKQVEKNYVRKLTIEKRYMINFVTSYFLLENNNADLYITGILKAMPYITDLNIFNINATDKCFKYMKNVEYLRIYPMYGFDLTQNLDKLVNLKSLEIGDLSIRGPQIIIDRNIWNVEPDEELVKRGCPYDLTHLHLIPKLESLLINLYYGIRSVIDYSGFGKTDTLKKLFIILHQRNVANNLPNPFRGIDKIRSLTELQIISRSTTPIIDFSELINLEDLHIYAPFTGNMNFETMYDLKKLKKIFFQGYDNNINVFPTNLFINLENLESLFLKNLQGGDNLRLPKSLKKLRLEYTNVRIQFNEDMKLEEFHINASYNQPIIHSNLKEITIFAGPRYITSDEIKIILDNSKNTLKMLKTDRVDVLNDELLSKLINLEALCIFETNYKSKVSGKFLLKMKNEIVITEECRIRLFKNSSIRILISDYATIPFKELQQEVKEYEDEIYLINI